MAALLSDTDIQAKVNQLNGWTLDGKTIKTERTFDGFPSAIAFVNKLVDPAEAAGHHPDIAISYNRVTIQLTSHDAGGLTDKDFDMAQQINQIT